MAKNPRNKSKTIDGEEGKSTTGVEQPAIYETYPLSPTDIEIIIHIKWNGKGYELSQRAPKTSVSLTGEDLQIHARRLPFDPARRDPQNRSVEYNIANADDLMAMMHRVHRVQLVSDAKKLPQEFSGSDWVANKWGVEKPDGYGILLHRPML